MREHWVAAHRLPSPRESFAEHQEILDALRRREPDVAQRLMEAHIAYGPWAPELASLVTTSTYALESPRNDWDAPVYQSSVR